MSADLDVAQHVLRFWETKFSQIRPLKRAGKRRYYRPDDVALLRRIRQLLYDEGYTIRGVQKLIREKGVRAVLSDVPPATGDGNGEQPAAAATVAAQPEPNGAEEGADQDLAQIIRELEELGKALRAIAQ